MDFQVMVDGFSAASEKGVFITSQRMQSHSRRLIHPLTFIHPHQVLFVFRHLDGAYVNRRLAFESKSCALNSLKAPTFNNIQ